MIEVLSMMESQGDDDMNRYDRQLAEFQDFRQNIKTLTEEAVTPELMADLLAFYKFRPGTIDCADVVREHYGLVMRYYRGLKQHADWRADAVADIFTRHGFDPRGGQ